ncbi:MAG: hypothetical protein LBD94_03130, partial [Rickettsiales bacterium]|jgi:hypothetical protein|nr:hypothetical protein [Rickettsiales bacterium]
VHCQKVIGKTVDEDGREIFPYLDYIMPVNKIRVNHYSVKSRKEFAMRGRRGNAVDGLFRHNEKYFKSHDTNEIFDPIMDRWIKKMKSGG